jgi:catechol 2,3-dioxygenase-like lactoylglutathione lyase family enzyme
MKMIPLFHCRDMKEAISFYTDILDFELKYPNDSSPDDWVIDLINSDAELQLTSLEGDQRGGVAVNVAVDDVDTLFDKYIKRGLDVSGKKNSPVHQGPLDQSWGTREFYVTDPTGNTLRFRKPIE